MHIETQSRVLAVVLSFVTTLPILASAQNAHAREYFRNTTPLEDKADEAKTAADLDLEQLANVDVKVTSASRKSESLFGAPAAIYSLSQEDIQRGGFTTLPEALRVVPGLYVGRTNSHIWQISTRGFGDLNNNKMLVLVDGRSMYTPNNGTVYWDALDIPLENIERVEVIRGPGGTLWGANAVNGVINIVTKSADQTSGVMVSMSASPEEGYSSTIQYGGAIGRNANYRLFGRASYWEPLRSATGAPLPDHFGMPQAGARVDWSFSAKDVLTVEAGAFDGRLVSTVLGTLPPRSFLVKGNHILAHWKHTASERSSTDTLAYCDWYARFGAPGEMRNTCDLEFQHSYEFNKRHALIWGGSFFTTGDHLTADPAPYSPERRRTHVVSGFAQYELVVVRNRIRLLAGSKFEGNSYTGEEYQPQVRAVWTPGKSHAVWASVSRAIRVPTRNNSDLRLVRPAGVSNGKPVFVAITGNPDLEEERLRAYELGYRFEHSPIVSFDLALYYNDYSELIITSPAVPEVLPDRIILHTPFINGPRAQTHGAELSAKWRPLPRWSITTGITELRGSAIAVQATPQHVFNVLSRLDLPHGLEFDSGVYRYGGVPPGRPQNSPVLPLQDVASFTRLDLGMGWRVTPDWRLAVWGRNLQSARHRETRDTIFADQAGNVPRSIVLSLLWQFNRERKTPH